MQLAKHLRCSLHVEALNNAYLLFIYDTPSSYDAINQVRRLKEELEELLKKLQKGRMEGEY